ncbi:MAG TPA: hypothetical protein VN522_14530 [Solirubrobacterales bacterium]|nr:hypothetical protein [Solirubrobacterales bacterium]
MEAARATWTDSRLDDLKETVTSIDENVGRLDVKVDTGFGRLDHRIDKLNHNLVQGLIALIAIIAVLLSALVTIVATHI